jgi:hypothetical protein
MKTNTVYLSKGGCIQGRGLLVVNPPAAFVSSHEAGIKSRKNLSLWDLAGLRGTMSRRENCFVLEVGHGEEIAVGANLGLTREQRNAMATAGQAWWCKTTNGGGCDSLWVAVSNAVSEIERQRKAAEDAANAATIARERASQREAAIASAGVQAALEAGDYGCNPWRELAAELAGDRSIEQIRESLKGEVSAEMARRKAAAERAAEDARIMAELEAEEKAAKDARAEAAAGITPEMSPKQRRIALHNARMAGKV